MNFMNISHLFQTCFGGSSVVQANSNKIHLNISTKTRVDFVVILQNSIRLKPLIGNFIVLKSDKVAIAIRNLE